MIGNWNFEIRNWDLGLVAILAPDDIHQPPDRFIKGVDISHAEMTLPALHFNIPSSDHGFNRDPDYYFEPDGIISC